MAKHENNGSWLYLFAQNGLQSGEVDIIEGVHDNEHNQVAYHTTPSALPPDTTIDCLLGLGVSVTGTIHVCSADIQYLVSHLCYSFQTLNGKLNLICDGNINYNSGCSFTDWSRTT